MNITPMISFLAERAVVNIGMTHEGAKQRSIVLTLKLEAGEDVETSDRRSLRNSEWSVSLVEGSVFNAHATKEQAIGFLSHHTESKSDYDYSSESCYASAAIEPAAFSALWKLVTAGRLPDWLSITVKNMTYGYDPDGREKVWDVIQNRTVAITEVSIRFPVARLPPAEKPSDDFDAVQANLPATSADARASADQIAKSLGELQAQVIRHLRYVAGIGAFIAVYMLLK